MKPLTLVKTPTPHLNTKELAARWKIHKGTLSNWRNQGKTGGPRFIKVGRKILYPLDGIEAYERTNTKRSTVE